MNHAAVIHWEPALWFIHLFSNTAEDIFSPDLRYHLCLRETSWIIWFHLSLVVGCCVWYKECILSSFNLKCVLSLPCWVTWMRLLRNHLTEALPTHEDWAFCPITPHGSSVFREPVVALKLSIHPTHGIGWDVIIIIMWKKKMVCESIDAVHLYVLY